MLKHRFCDLPKGTRFKYPGSDRVWISIECHGDGLVAEEINPKDIIKGAHNWQSLCCFVDGDEWTLQSEVEVITND